MTSAEEAVARAEALMAVGRFQDALGVLAPAMGSDDMAFQARCLASQCNIQLGNTAEALNQAEWALPLQPWNDWPHRLIAIAHLQSGRSGRSAALEHATEAARLAPAQPEALHLLVAAQLANKQVDAAAATAAIALETCPDEALAHHTQALVCEARKDWAGAEDAYRRALAIEPDDPELAIGLAQALERRGRKHHAAAGEAYVAAARANPTDDSSRKGLARLGVPATLLIALKVGASTGMRESTGKLHSAFLIACVICGSLLALAGVIAAFRIHATRHLPEGVRRGLRAQYWDEAMGWVALAGFVAVGFGLALATSPSEQDGMWQAEVAALLAFGAVALFLGRHRIVRAVRAPARWYRRYVG